MRTTSGEPAKVCILLPAHWIACLDRATELIRKRNPRMPDGELLQTVLGVGIMSTIQLYDSNQLEKGKS